MYNIPAAYPARRNTRISGKVSLAPMSKLLTSIQRIVRAPAFEYSIILLILFNALILGIQTSPAMVAQYGGLLDLGHDIVLVVFVIEALLKMAALAPRSYRYFLDGWNVFDFLIVVLSLVPATGGLAMLARLARLLRVLRLISAIRDLRLITAALLRSIPGVGNVVMLVSVIIYIYAIVGHQLFSEHDPENWRNLGVSALTLFQIITLEGWNDVLKTAMQLNSLAWIYFVSFVIICTFVVINLFIAIIINNLEEAKLDQLPTDDMSAEDMLRELRRTQDTLRRIELRMQAVLSAASSRPNDPEDTSDDQPNEERRNGS